MIFDIETWGQNDRIYLKPIMDLFSGEVLIFSIGNHPTTEFAIKSLKEISEAVLKLSHRTIVYTY
ncbi:transposase-like protein [Companilactobacillus farciminis]|jgi:transposase InsO family protein|nr:transposase-like protein [Companilactobacillus farciminis]